jgi:hypothetical protein
MGAALVLLIDVDTDLDRFLCQIYANSLCELNQMMLDTLIAKQSPFPVAYNERVDAMLWMLEERVRDVINCSDFQINPDVTVHLRSDRQFQIQVPHHVI